MKHPVFNDEEMIFWDQLERRSWPSIAIISPEGCPILFLSGEGHRDRLDLFLDAAVDYYDDSLNRTPIDIYLEEEKEAKDRETKSIRSKSLSKEERAVLKSNLRFPSKIITIHNQPCLLYDCNILVVSDTGNNRVIILNLDTYE